MLLFAMALNNKGKTILLQEYKRGPEQSSYIYIVESQIISWDEAIMNCQIKFCSGLCLQILSELLLHSCSHVLAFIFFVVVAIVNYSASLKGCNIKLFMFCIFRYQPLLLLFLIDNLLYTAPVLSLFMCLGCHLCCLDAA